MEFAEMQLKKYGWVKGDGLGKSVKGVAEPIKVRLKQDSAGIGCSAGSEFTSNWWSNVFNQAAKAINVREDAEDGAVTIQTASDSSLERTRKLYGNHRKELYHGGFVSSGTQLSGSTTAVEVNGERRSREEEKDDGDEEEDDVGVEERLFEACGGRTAHKAARHGCQLNGKLLRLKEQEKALEEEIQKTEEWEEQAGKRRKVLQEPAGEEDSNKVEQTKQWKINEGHKQKKIRRVHKTKCK